MFIDGVVGRDAAFRTQPRFERADAARAAYDTATGGGSARGFGRERGRPPRLPLATTHITPRIRSVFLGLARKKFNYTLFFLQRCLILTCLSSGGKKKRKYSGSADTDADWLPSAKGKHGSDDIPKRKSKRSLKPKTER